MYLQIVQVPLKVAPNGAKKGPAEKGRDVRIKGAGRADSSVSLRGSFLLLLLLLRLYSPSRLLFATMEKVRGGQGGNDTNHRRRTLYWQKCSLRFCLSSFIWTMAGEAKESGKQTITDICCQLLEEERSREKRREKLHSHIVN